MFGLEFESMNLNPIEMMNDFVSSGDKNSLRFIRKCQIV